MPHESILALIDVEIDRLLQARALLTEFMEPVARGSQKKKQDFQEENPESQVTPVLTELKQVTVRVLPPRQSRRRGATGPRARKDESALAGALSGSVPKGPVAVSAGHVKQMQSVPHATSRESGQGAAPENLTPEMLAQRWFRSSTT